MLYQKGKVQHRPSGDGEDRNFENGAIPNMVVKAAPALPGW
jgi:hypothetical protein